MLKEEQFKVLKALSEATNRMDINMFAKKINLNPNQAIQQVQELGKRVFYKKSAADLALLTKEKQP